MNKAVGLAGLSAQEAKDKLEEFGPNKLPEQRLRIMPLRIYDALRGDFLMLILIASAAVSIFLSEYITGGIILILVASNVGIGQWQEGKARKQTEALKRFTSPTTNVIRGGVRMEVNAEELVPEDILVLREGNKIPADATVLDAEELQVDEAILTGESIAVYKTPDQEIFSGTTITSGIGHARVFATGLNSRLGQIAEQLMEDEQPESPLTTEMNDLAEKLAQIILSLCVVVVGVLLHNGGIPGLITGLMSGGMFALVLAIAFPIPKLLKPVLYIGGGAAVGYALYSMHVGGHDFGLFKEIFIFYAHKAQNCKA